jgi:hypothetical protein
MVTNAGDNRIKNQPYDRGSVRSHGGTHPRRSENTPTSRAAAQAAPLILSDGCEKLVRLGCASSHAETLTCT